MLHILTTQDLILFVSYVEYAACTVEQEVSLMAILMVNISLRAVRLKCDLPNVYKQHHSTKFSFDLVQASD